MYETIITEMRGQTGWIILNREERRNSMNPAMLRELLAAFKEHEDNKEVVSLVLTGAGDRAFCAGMDLGGGEAMQLGPIDRHELQRIFVSLLKAMKELNKPIVARVQGLALGGGLGLMSACDLVIASEDAQFGTPEINLGLFPYIIMATLIRNTRSSKQLLELMLIGEKIGAAEACEIGFVNRVVKSDKLDHAVEALSNKLNGKSPAILRLGRRAYYTMRDLDYEHAMEYLSAMLALNMQAEDMIEGISAFMEKREPHWQGK